MNTRNLKLVAAMPAIAMGLTFTVPVLAQTAGSGTASPPASQQDTDSSETMTRSQTYDATRSYDRSSNLSQMDAPKKSDSLFGKEVKGDDGNNLGAVSDFVIDSSSGKITHAVIRAGGVLGVGAEHKAVPFDSLQAAAGDDDSFTLAASEWTSAQEFREDQLTSLASDQDSASSTMSPLVLASKMDDLEIRNQEGNEVGEVEDLVVKTDEAKALLLVEVEDDIAGDDRDFIVGFDRVTFGGTQDDRSLSTDLQESDFRTAAANETSTTQSYIWLDGESERAVAE